MNNGETYKNCSRVNVFFVPLTALKLLPLGKAKRKQAFLFTFLSLIRTFARRNEHSRYGKRRDDEEIPAVPEVGEELHG